MMCKKYKRYDMLTIGVIFYEISTNFGDLDIIFSPLILSQEEWHGMIACILKFHYHHHHHHQCFVNTSPSL